MRIIPFMQEGGAAPAPQQGQDQAMQQIAQLAEQLINEMGPEAAAMLAQTIMDMLQGAPEEMGGAPQEQQFMRCGGKLKKKTCKKACGGSVKKSACGGSVKKSACGGSVKKGACGTKVASAACGKKISSKSGAAKCKSKKGCK